MAWEPLSPGRLHCLSFGTAFGMTDVGLVRQTNEDNFLIDEALGLVMVGDGMGGHEAGEVASAGALTAVQHCLQQHWQQLAGAPSGVAQDKQEQSAAGAFFTDDPDVTWTDDTLPAIGVLFDAVEFANGKLHAQNMALDHAEGSGMGTTLTGLWRPRLDGPMIVCHVGDSRLYRCRQGVLTLLTRDQTLFQQAIDGGRIDALPPRNMLLQAVGPSASVKPDIKPHVVEAGDLFLLCSDGLHGSVAHADLEVIMASARATGFEAACAQLIALAKADGGRDNITVVLLESDGMIRANHTGAATC
jgi:serine/threonine protein phosphatase PrpC